LPKGVLRGYGRALLENNRRTVANLLKDNGYNTGVVGKWHLGLDWVIKEGNENVLKEESTQTNEVGLLQEMDPKYIDHNQKPSDGPLDHGFDYIKEDLQETNNHYTQHPEKVEELTALLNKIKEK